jgi:uncharacterized protein
VPNVPLKPRIVIDTNVFVSAIVFGGTPRRIVELITQKHIRPVISEELLTELRRIIHTKFPRHSPVLQSYEAQIRHYSIAVPLGTHTVNVCRDPDDNKILETAYLGNCHFLVTGDKDLLELDSYQNIQIITPTDFVAYKNG